MAQLPDSKQWRFDTIQAADRSRASRLEVSPEFDDIVSDLGLALQAAVSDNSVRFGLDTYEGYERVTAQFRVSPYLFDAFFNGRTGYRAHFWASPELGLNANALCCRTLLAALEGLRTPTLASVIDDVGNGHGETRPQAIRLTSLDRQKLRSSLRSEVTKIWIAEQLLPAELRTLDQVSTDGLKLDVDRWVCARAPLPETGKCWIDLKGCHIGGKQTKMPSDRATEIHKTGFS